MCEARWDSARRAGLKGKPDGTSSEQVSVSAWKFLQLCFRGISLVFAKPQHNKRGTNNLTVCFVLMSAFSANSSFAETAVGLRMNDIR